MLKGSQVTSSAVSFVFMMQPLCYLTLSLLWSLPLLPSGLTIQCNKTQYKWPLPNPTLCCPMCPPGQRYIKRSPTTCEIECQDCDEGRYSAVYSLERHCNLCDDCIDAFETVSSCTPTSNAVCKCRAGYRCKDASCSFCEPLPKTIKPTAPPPTTAGATSTTKTTGKPVTTLRDTQWFLLIIALLCAGIALVVVTKIKPLLHWIRSTHGYILAQKVAPAPPCAVEDDVSKPVQEMCGKCDHCIELCIKE